MKNRFRAILGGTSAAALIAAGALLATPAQAVPVTDFVDNQTTTDGGGVTFNVSVEWNYEYTDNNGNKRASVSPLTIGTKEDIDDAGIDYRFRVYSFHTSDGKWYKIQDSIVDGNDHDAVNPVTRNPKNPLSVPGKSKIVVTRVGVDGDGEVGGPSRTFLQPELGPKAAS